MARGLPRRSHRHDGLLKVCWSNPCHDHFKKIDDDAVLGIMNGKGVLDDGRYYYFYLERV